ncbi:PilZ domain-containing protein [Nocardioides sp. Kera G14]|uniref:PilZ domain-containing protein n=1 Tax=Nocardioides sp. Kera G14 TaxID=2884264 RepID=UPI001D11C263|nr:PilZ domain-containing protein [Nocardioides sp. Kera G14]UDY24467.1 PilZ domain-containing protein [Nocardioides sp. Kera G14]
MTVSMPAVNQTVALHTSGGGQYSALVLRHEDGCAVVARPNGLTEPEGLEPTVTIDITWSGDVGQHLVPAEIVAAAVEPGLQTWTLRPIGVALELDRRLFPRIDLNVPMTLGIVGQRTALGTCLLVDLSEVGLRARLDRTEAEQLDADTELAIRFTADGVDFTMLGRALRLKAVGAEEDLVDVVILFDLTADSRALLRAALAAEVDD